MDRPKLVGIFRQPPEKTGKLGIFSPKCPLRARFAAHFRREPCLCSWHGEWKRLENKNDRQEDCDPRSETATAAGFVRPDWFAEPLRSHRHRGGRRRVPLFEPWQADYGARQGAAHRPALRAGELTPHAG